MHHNPLRGSLSQREVDLVKQTAPMAGVQSAHHTSGSDGGPRGGFRNNAVVKARLDTQRRSAEECTWMRPGMPASLDTEKE